MGASWVRQKGGRQQRRPLVRESDIQQTCSQLLELDGWRVLITDPCSDRSLGKGFGEKGMADALYIRYSFQRIEHGVNSVAFVESIARRAKAEILWVEFKAKGGTVQERQDAWHTKERAAGALTWIAKRDFPPTIEGFWAYYRHSGLMRLDITLGALDCAR